jgi:hypothetical protein
MSVCSNQNEFDQAIHHGLKYYRHKEKPNFVVQAILLIIYLAFLVLALKLALKVEPSQRQVHLVLAFLFPPFYIIAAILNRRP